MGLRHLSFRARLRLFFLVIVVIPMITMAVVLYQLIVASEKSQTDARLAESQTVATGVYEESTAEAAQVAKSIGQDQQLADALAAGKTREQAWPTVRKQVDGLGNGYARIGSVVTAVADLAAVDAKSLVGDAKPDEIGVGVAQGTHPEIGEGAIWIVVLLAEKKK